MAAGIAHDLNNTLATILGQAELLRLRARQPDLQDGLQTLLTATTDGAQVVRRLQDFARQRGSGPLTPCNLGELVAETLEITRPRWREDPRRKGIVIEAVAELGGLPPVEGNPAEIREVLPLGGLFELRTFLYLEAVAELLSGVMEDAREDGPAVGDINPVMLSAFKLLRERVEQPLKRQREVFQ